MLPGMRSLKPDLPAPSASARLWPRVQGPVTHLRLLDRDAEDRGNEIPAQIHLLGRVKQVGLKPVEIEPQITDQNKAGPDIKRVGGRFRGAADRVDHCTNGPGIVHRRSGHLPGLVGATYRIARSEPEARVVNDVRLGGRDVGDDREVRAKDAIGFVFEHGWLLLPRVTEVAALLGYVLGRFRALKVWSRCRRQSRHGTPGQAPSLPRR